MNVIDRKPEYFMKYYNKLYSDRPMNYHSDDKNKGVIIVGKKIKQDFVKQILIKYINEFVICPSCSSFETTFKKNKDVKKYNFQCKNCGFNKYC